MPHRVTQYLRCPQCSKKGVTRRETTSESHWGCRYCDWYAFTFGEDAVDVDARLALSRANPDLEVWVTDRPAPPRSA